ncbi:MAG: cyclic nucleotide-binding domain-containing protein [Proteobacteria bacterium]|nr:cyclic nucleotide-binding domain-containing protein [Pseudomonadota bacterium]
MAEKSNPRDVYSSNMYARIMEALQKVPLFSNLEKPEMEVLSRHMYHYEVHEGDVVFLEGEKGGYMCFVAQGTLDVSKSVPGKGPVVINRVERGQSIGEMSVVDDFPRSANVMAKTDSILVTLSRADFEEILVRHPSLGIRILEGLTRLLSINLRRTSTQLADYMLPLV